MLVPCVGLALPVPACAKMSVTGTVTLIAVTGTVTLIAARTRSILRPRPERLLFPLTDVQIIRNIEVRCRPQAAGAKQLKKEVEKGDRTELF